MISRQQHTRPKSLPKTPTAGLVFREIITGRWQYMLIVGIVLVRTVTPALAETKQPFDFTIPLDTKPLFTKKGAPFCFTTPADFSIFLTLFLGGAGYEEYKK